MYHLLLVGLGGFVGSVLRYVANQQVQRWTGREDLPLGTLVVNVVGCLIIGMIAQFADMRGALSAETRLLIVVGFLGGFTTYSSFGNETVDLWRSGATTWSLANIFGQLILGLGAVVLGRWIALQIWK